LVKLTIHRSTLIALLSLVVVIFGAKWFDDVLASVPQPPSCNSFSQSPVCKQLQPPLEVVFSGFGILVVSSVVLYHDYKKEKAGKLAKPLLSQDNSDSRSSQIRVQ